MNIVLLRENGFTALNNLENGKTYYIQAVYGDSDKPMVLASSNVRPAKIEEGFLGSDFKVTKKEGKDIWVAARFNPVNVHIEEIAVAGGGGETINNQDVEVIPSTVTQQITHDENHTGIGTVTVNAVTAAIDANIQAENIKKDVTILGVTGTLEGGGDVDYDTWKSYIINSVNEIDDKKDTAYAMNIETRYPLPDIGTVSFNNVRLIISPLECVGQSITFNALENITTQINISGNNTYSTEGEIVLNLPNVTNVTRGYAIQLQYADSATVNLDSFVSGYSSAYFLAQCGNLNHLTLNMPEATDLSEFSYIFGGYYTTINHDIIFNVPKLTKVGNYWINGHWDKITNLQSILNNLQEVLMYSFTAFTNENLVLPNVTRVDNSAFSNFETEFPLRIELPKAIDISPNTFSSCPATEIHFSAENQATIQTLAGYETLFGADIERTTIYFDLGNNSSNYGDSDRLPDINFGNEDFDII